MTTNTAIVEGLLRAFNEHDPEVLDAFVAPGVVVHGAGGQGLAGMKGDIGDFLTSFPDAHADLEDLVDLGDKVVFRNVCAGTNTGPFYGGPPTGRSIAYTEVTALRVENGKVAEAWYFHDEGSMMRQMGLAPADEPVA
jgi:predicted ester cyclase